MQSLKSAVRRPHVEDSRTPGKQAWQGPQQRVALHSSVTVPAAATTTSTLPLQQHFYADHDTQQLPPAAAGMFQQLRYVSATLAASVQQFQQQQLPQQQQQFLAQQPRQKPVIYDAAAAMLTKQLKLATTWRELQHLAQHYQSNGPSRDHEQQQQQQGLASLNSQLLSCLLSALVKCQPPAAAARYSKASATGAVRQDTKRFSSFVGQVFDQVLLLLPAMRPRELSNILWTAAKFNHPPENHKVRQIVTQMAQPGVLANANAQDVSMCMYAVASLGIQVPEQHIELLLAAATQPASRSTSPQALANTLWAVAILQYRPSEQWLSKMESTCAQLLQQHQQQSAASGSVLGPYLHQQQQHTGGFSSKGLHQVLWAMAKLQWVPSDAFLTSYWAVTQQQLATMTPHGAVGILWAAATLELHPPGTWIDTWFNSTLLQMQNGRFRDIDLANALWASVRLGLRPSASWLQQGLASAEAVLAEAGAQELSVMLGNFAKLDVRPPEPWMGFWLEAMHGRMSGYCAPALACSVYTLALLRFKPPRPWCERLVAELQRQMAAFGAQELSNIVWALATLGLRPNKAWFRDFQAQALNESSSFNSQELSILCWSLAKLQYTPPADWVAVLLRDGLEVQSDMRGQSVVLLMWALARWRLPEIKENGKYRMLLPRYWAAAHQLLPSCSLWQLSELWWARVQLGCMPSKAWSASFWNAVIPSLSAAVTAAAPAAEGRASLIGDVTAGSASLARLQDQQQQPQYRWVAASDPGYNASTVVQLVSATGKMTGLVPPAAQHLLMEAAEQWVMSCCMEALTALGMGLVRLHHQSVDAVAPGVAAGGRKQTLTAASVGVVGLRGCMGAWSHSSRASAVQRQGQQCSRLWEKWFARSTQLLQEQATQQCMQQQQQLHAAAARHSGTRNQQQQQAAEAVDSVDISLQLFIAGQMSASVQPPSSWVTTVLPAVILQLEAMSLEQLSWVLWSVIKIRVEHQLPASWLPEVLRRCRLLLQDDSSVDAGAVLRLHKSVQQLKRIGVLCEGECTLWSVVRAQWIGGQGLLAQ